MVFFSFFGWLYFTVLIPNQYAASLDKLGKMATEPDPIYFYGPPLTILPTLIVTAWLIVALNRNSFAAWPSRHNQAIHLHCLQIALLRNDRFHRISRIHPFY